MAFSAHDIVPDSPTNNFCTLNPLGFKNLGGNNSAQILSEGNLKTVASGNQGSGELPSIIPSKTGINKVYFEAKGVGSSTSTNGYIALFDGDGVNLNPTNVHRDVGQNEIVSWVIDVSEGKLWRQSNGNWSAARKIEIENGQNPDLTFNCSTNILEIWFATFSTDRGIVLNFGQDQSFAGTASGGAGATDSEGYGQFYYEPPTGALALCTANLPDFTPTVAGDVPQDYFKAVLYTGQTADSTFIDNGDNTWSKTGVGFQPDLVWIKKKSGSESHVIFDVLRGVDIGLTPDTNADELDFGIQAHSSFDADGFTLGANARTNESGQTYVAWCWKAGGAPSGSTSTTGSAKRINTSGTQDDTSCSALATAATNAGASNVITPTLMSINQAAGFSITKFTSPSTVNTDFTVPHGLSSAPDIVIQKETDSTGNWVVYHSSVVDHTDKLLFLNTTDELSTYAGYSFWGSHLVDENAVGFRSTQSFNEGSEVIMYCWHSVEGYSKFGSYTGNGSADGTFVYCGFRPAFVMIKNSDSSSNWSIFDSARDESNVVGRLLLGNESINESDIRSSYYPLDFLSNGFKLRTNALTGDTNINLSNTYIFMAFAEQPFKFSNAR